MYEITIKPEALRDFVLLWRSLKQSWGAQHADKYLKEIRTFIMNLPENPELGEARAYDGQFYRFLTINQTLVVYQLEGSYIDIKRVLHLRMKP